MPFKPHNKHEDEEPEHQPEVECCSPPVHPSRTCSFDLPALHVEATLPILIKGIIEPSFTSFCPDQN